MIKMSFSTYNKQFPQLPDESIDTQHSDFITLVERKMSDILSRNQETHLKCLKQRNPLNLSRFTEILINAVYELFKKKNFKQ